MIHSSTFKTNVTFLLLSCVWTVNCHAKPVSSDYYLDMGLEELMNIEVTSVSKKKQRLSETASAVFVISQEDIRRSGATNIPEVLRLAPGIQVARIDANKWAVGSRGLFGLNGRFENKLLVLVDGRTVYSPLFSGVFWEIQDTLLQDIDRIEIIRGPGATLWGANAVNGVINIITKEATDTQGGLAVGSVGTEIHGEAGVRYGSSFNDTTKYRIFSKYSNRDAAVFADGNDAADQWDSLRAGFRVDHEISPEDQFTLQGDIFRVNAGETLTVPKPTAPFVLTENPENTHRGGYLLGLWKRTLAGGAALELQAYYDRTEYNTSFIGSAVDTLDIDFQHNFNVLNHHDIIWGIGYRHIFDDIENSYSAGLIPDSDNYHIFNAFLQDDITLWDDDVHFIIGSKIEHNDFTGFEIQPNVRLVWQKDERQSLWAAISHAVRTPSRGERNNNIILPILFPATPPNTLPLPVQVKILGNTNIDSETMTAYEAGYRLQPTEALSFDLALFYNSYDKVRLGTDLEPILEYSPSLGSPLLTAPYLVNNALYGKTWGFEIASEWLVSDWWQLQASYSYLQMDVKTDTPIQLIDVNDLQERSPRHQLSVRSLMNLTETLELDIWARFVDNIRLNDGNNLVHDIDDYVNLDIRLGWHPKKNLEIALVGQNLLGGQRLEFVPEIFLTEPTETEISGYLQVTYKF